MYGRMFPYIKTSQYHHARNPRSRVEESPQFARSPACDDFVAALGYYRSPETHDMFCAIDECGQRSDFVGVRDILQDNQQLLQSCWERKVDRAIRTGVFGLTISLALTALDCFGVSQFWSSAAQEDSVAASDFRVIGTLVCVAVSPLLLMGIYSSSKKICAKRMIPTPEQLIEKIDDVIAHQPRPEYFRI